LASFTIHINNDQESTTAVAGQQISKKLPAHAKPWWNDSVGYLQTYVLALLERKYQCQIISNYLQALMIRKTSIRSLSKAPTNSDRKQGPCQNYKNMKTLKKKMAQYQK
jgi:glutamyl/glutaminyl-tRNA synthetase